jgi:hypothetical protein
MFQCGSCKKNYKRLDHLARHVRSRKSYPPPRQLSDWGCWLTTDHRYADETLQVPCLPESFHKTVSLLHGAAQR